MPPKAGSGGAPRGRPKGGGGGKAKAAKPAASEPMDQDLLDPFASSSATEGEDDEAAGAGAEGSGQQQQRQQQSRGAAGEEPREAEKAVPRELLTRILHEFFAKDATRMSRDANAAVGKYVDVFVREAIARTAVEKKGGFLEVEDLEKISPQLLLDL